MVVLINATGVRLWPGKHLEMYDQIAVRPTRDFTRICGSAFDPSNIAQDALLTQESAFCGCLRAVLLTFDLICGTSKRYVLSILLGKEGQSRRTAPGVYSVQKEAGHLSPYESCSDLESARIK